MSTHLALETTFYLHPFLTMNTIPAQMRRLAIFQKDQSLRLGTMAYSGPGGGLGSNHTQAWGLRKGIPYPQHPQALYGQCALLKNYEILCYLCVSDFLLQRPSGCYHCHP